MDYEKAFANCLSATNVSQYRYFKSIGSTNSEALSWALAGAQDFSLVIADEQTLGRGRFNRRWITNPGDALAFSFILHPDLVEAKHIPLFSALAGIAVSEAVDIFLGVQTEIKWPNDVLLNQRKFCGILVEVLWEVESPAAIIVGIGINVNNGAIPKIEDQSFSATSLEAETDHLVDRYALLREIVYRFNEWRSKLGSPEFLERWQQHLAFRDQWVRVEHSEKPTVVGKLYGIDDQGRLVLTDATDRTIAFEIGDVHLRQGSIRNGGT